jgi:hypothetical protein
MYYQQKAMHTGLQVLGAVLWFTVMAGASVPGLCNTGLSNNNGSGPACTGPLETLGGRDPNWKIVFNPSQVSLSSYIPNPCAAANPPGWVVPTLSFQQAWVDQPDPAWLPNSGSYSASASEWITPQTELSDGGYYIYAITFPIPAGETQVTIDGQLLSDNEVGAIYLSYGAPGTPPSSATECIPFAGYPYDNAALNGPSDFVPPWTTFETVKAPVPTDGSPATLYFVVRNRGVGGIDSNPTDTGLRVRFNQTTSRFWP